MIEFTLILTAVVFIWFINKTKCDVQKEINDSQKNIKYKNILRMKK